MYMHVNPRIRHAELEPHSEVELDTQVYDRGHLTMQAVAGHI